MTCVFINCCRQSRRLFSRGRFLIISSINNLRFWPATRLKASSCCHGGAMTSMHSDFSFLLSFFHSFPLSFHWSAIRRRTKNRTQIFVVFPKGECFNLRIQGDFRCKKNCPRSVQIFEFAQILKIPCLDFTSPCTMQKKSGKKMNRRLLKYRICALKQAQVDSCTISYHKVTAIERSTFARTRTFRVYTNRGNMNDRKNPRSLQIHICIYI